MVDSQHPSSTEQVEPVLLSPREVPLIGADGMRVHRLLPRRKVSLIGGWCFLDHFGPTDAQMRVAGHPHTGLQTVTWLFSGTVRHRDALGTDIVVQPGELNLMTSGRAISHTEYSEIGVLLHGVQLWTVLPEAHRFTESHFEHFSPEPERIGDHELAVFIGDLGGVNSPVKVYSPMLGAEIRFTSEESVKISVEPEWQYGVLADSGSVTVNGHEVAAGHLAYFQPGSTSLTLSAVLEGEHPVRAILIGGEPVDEEIIMWWNLIARENDEISDWRGNWQTAIGAESGGDPEMFLPLVARTDDEPEIPAPPLPPFPLLPRVPPASR